MIAALVVNRGEAPRPSSASGRGRGVHAGAAEDSERCVVACEEVELSVVARALDIAKFLVVAADLVEVLALEGEGEVVEELAELGGGLVAECVG